MPRTRRALCRTRGSFAERMDVKRETPEKSKFYPPHVEDNPEWKEESFRCSHCDAQFKKEGFLTRHLRLHDDRIRPCEQCKSKVPTNGCHGCWSDVDGPDLFECLICEKTFRQKCNLEAHMRVHTGERPFLCPICETAFKQKSALDNHIRRHTGERPFPCRECGTKFRQRSHLDNHLRTHTGEKPYSCNRCEASFTQRSNLNDHMHSHDGSSLKRSRRKIRKARNSKTPVPSKRKMRDRLKGERDFFDTLGLRPVKRESVDGDSLCSNRTDALN